jgi:uncharacterized protein (TIGR03067 family)
MSEWWERVRFMIVRDRLTLRDGVAIASDATIALRDQKKPKQIDISPTVGPNRGKAALGVYRVSGDTFEFCVVPQGESRPAKLLPESQHQVGRLVLQRESQ